MARSQSPRPAPLRRALTQPADGTVTLRFAMPAPASGRVSQLRSFAEGLARPVDASDTSGGGAAAAGAASRAAPSSAPASPRVRAPPTEGGNATSGDYLRAAGRAVRPAPRPGHPDAPRRPRTASAWWSRPLARPSGSRAPPALPRARRGGPTRSARGRARAAPRAPRGAAGRAAPGRRRASRGAPPKPPRGPPPPPRPPAPA